MLKFIEASKKISQNLKERESYDQALRELKGEVSNAKEEASSKIQTLRDLVEQMKKQNDPVVAEDIDLEIDYLDFTLEEMDEADGSRLLD